MTIEHKTLTIFRPVEEDPVVCSMLKLLRIGRNIGSSLKMLEDFTQEYARLFALLAGVTELAADPQVGTPWQNHLLNIILETENVFTLKAEAAPPAAMGQALKLGAARDLRYLQELFRIDAQSLLQSYAEKTSHMAAKNDDTGSPGEDLPSWTEFLPLPHPPLSALQILRHNMKKNLAAAEDWGEHIETLAGYFRSAGSGLFGKYQAFRWQAGAAGSIQKGGRFAGVPAHDADKLTGVPHPDSVRLVGIPHPDPVKLNELVDYEDPKQTVTENTERFLRGLPANNVLLYGDRGTGKSSTVKALLNEYAAKGLRIVELAKQDLGDFPALLEILQPRPHKFIVFIDDLSFADNEGEYRHLKAVLEGSLAVRPVNVLIYATSNRRHLVREYFSDRCDPADEVRSQDTVQEKLSLADRFGITVTYTAPDQEGYLAIVEAMVRQRNLVISSGELRELAVRWELRYNGRSGRTARQFVDWLEGKLAVETP